MLFAEDECETQFTNMFLTSVALVVAGVLIPGVLQGILSPSSTVGSFCTVLDHQELPHGLATVASSVLSTIMIAALIHTIYISFSKWRYVYSSGMDVKVFSSLDGHHHRQILISMTKGMALSTLLKLLECLPIPYLVFQAISGRPVNQEFKLSSIIMVLTIHGFWHPYVFVWRDFISRTRVAR